MMALFSMAIAVTHLYLWKRLAKEQPGLAAVALFITANIWLAATYVIVAGRP